MIDNAIMERAYDQARSEMGVCIQAKDGNWCVRHDILKFPGEEACARMTVAYGIAERVVEVVEPLIRKDQDDKECDHCYDVEKTTRRHIAYEINTAHERAGDECYQPGMGALLWPACSHLEDAAIARGKS